MIVTEYNHGYTMSMKTAISIPDDLFQRAEQAAKRLGVSRSEFYANAVREFVERHQRATITQKLNELYSDDESVSELDARWLALQTESLSKEEW